MDLTRNSLHGDSVILSKSKDFGATVFRSGRSDRATCDHTPKLPQRGMPPYTGHWSPPLHDRTMVRGRHRKWRRASILLRPPLTPELGKRCHTHVTLSA